MKLTKSEIAWELVRLHISKNDNEIWNSKDKVFNIGHIINKYDYYLEELTEYYRDFGAEG